MPDQATTAPQLSTATLDHLSPATAAPSYERSDINVGMVHIGLGGFSRAHQALYLDDLLGLDQDAREYGLCGVNLLPQDARMAQVMREQDGLYVIAERGAQGQSCRVIGSVVDYLFAPEDPEAVLTRMADPATKVVSLTITEGGYCYDPATGEVDLDADGLREDIASPTSPRTAFGYLLEALRRRRAAGDEPFTVLSCDNVHANGDVAQRTLLAVARAQDPELASWVQAHVAFPNSMVDRITPRTTEADVKVVAQATGVHDSWPVVCEPFRQWVVEDRFPAGRPAWERVGVQLVPDVRPYEKLKMRTVNAGHQSISYAGLLLGHPDGVSACGDPVIAALLEHYLRREGALSLPEIPGVDVQDYCTTVIERFSNPAIKDSIERLTTSSSTTLTTFVLPVIRDLLASGRDASAATLVVACWVRAWLGRDDAGRPIQVVDERAAELSAAAQGLDQDPLALVRGNPMFAGLEQEEGFTVPLARIVRSMLAEGVRVTLTSELQAVRTTN